MSNSQSTPKELQISCVLGVISAPDGGTTGSTSARAFKQSDPANLVPQTMYASQRTSSYSQRVISIPQAGGMLCGPVNRFIGAPMATFIYGGIDAGSGTPHPQLNLITGPSIGVNDFGLGMPTISYDPTFTPPDATFGTSVGTGTNAPTVSDNSVSNTGMLLFPTIPASTNTMYPKATNVLETYNIWNPIDSVITGYQKYGSPSFSTQDTGGRAKQVFSDNSMAIQVWAANSSIRLQRVFPISYDLMYLNTRQNPRIYYPPLPNTNLAPPYTSIGDRPILAQGGDNCGFQLHFKASEFGSQTNAAAKKGAGIMITWGVPVGSNNPPSGLSVGSDPSNAVQTFRLHLPPNGHAIFSCVMPADKASGKYTNFEIKSPEAFRVGGDYHVYVHYAGPFMLIGFDDNPESWNCIHTLGENIDWQFYYPLVPADSTIELTFSYVTATFQYGPIAFNNFNWENINTANITSDFAQGADRSYINTSMSLPKNMDVVQNSITTSSGTIIDTTMPLITNLGKFGSASVNTTFQSQSYCSPKLTTWFQSGLTGTYTTRPTYYEDWRYRQTPHMHYEEPNPSQRSTDPITGDQIVPGKIVFDNVVESPLFFHFTYSGYNTTTPNLIQPLSWTNSAQDISQFFIDADINYKLEGDFRNFLNGTCHLKLKNMMNTEQGRQIVSIAQQNVLAVTISAGFNKDEMNVFFQGLLEHIGTTYSIDGSSDTEMRFQDIAYAILNTTNATTPRWFDTMRYGDIISELVNMSGLGRWYEQSYSQFSLDPNSPNYITSSDYRYPFLYILNNKIGHTPLSCEMAHDIMSVTPYDVIYDKLRKILALSGGQANWVVLWWNPESQLLKLDFRNDPSTIDTLYFTGIPDPKTGEITLPNTVNATQPDGLHGVLSGQYNTMHDVGGLQAGMLLLGVGTDGLTLDQRWPLPGTGPNPAWSDDALAAIQSAIGTKGIQSNIEGYDENGYIGYRRQRTSYHHSPLLSDRHTLTEYGNRIYDTYLRQVHNTISFSCYVTKPLNHQSMFNIASFLDKTDNYLYQSVNYKIEKNKNIITANVDGEAFPKIIG